MSHSCPQHFRGDVQCTLGTKVVERAVSLWNNQALVRTRRVRAHSKKSWRMQGFLLLSGFQSAQWRKHSGSVGVGCCLRLWDVQSLDWVQGQGTHGD